MIAVAMGEDNGADGLRGDLGDGVEQLLAAGLGGFGIDDDYAVGSDDDCAVASRRPRPSRCWASAGE